MQLSGLFLQLSSLVLLALVVEAAPKNGKNSGKQSHPNVIQIITDGFGPASETFARSYMQSKKGQAWTEELPLDKFFVGNVRTRSTDSLVTDSAASATAYSCGIKSINAYIGVDTEKKPCGTILEAAKVKGYHVGLVTTSRITHATPASYSAHVDDRDAEDETASQQIGNYLLGRQADILWGGGLRHFLPNTTKPGIRKDAFNLVEQAQERGFSFISDRAGFDALQGGKNFTFPSFALFASSHMSYEVDRKPEEEPSLKEMALTALTALRDTGKPYFIMIEAARIDHAAHNNDPVGHVGDIIANEEMIEAVTKWMDDNAKNNPDEPETVLLSVADHECGGPTLGLERSEDEEAYYGWFPNVLFNATHSTEYLAGAVYDWLEEANRTDSELTTYLKDEIVVKGLGLQDAQDDEVARAAQIARLEDGAIALGVWLSSMLNWRAHIGWSTTGHSGVDVNLYYHEAKPSKKSGKKYQNYESRRKSVVGAHENTWIREWTSKLLDLDLHSITKKLNNGSDYKWANNWGDKLNVFTDKLEHYHGGLARVIPPIPASLAALSKRDVGYSHKENEPVLRSIHGPRNPGKAERSHSRSKRDEL